MMLGMVVAGGLSDAERRVWDAFPTGRRVAFGTGHMEEDDPAGGEGWGPDRQVRAEILGRLLCGAIEMEPGQMGSIYLDGARIVGKLELPGAAFNHRLQLNACYIPDGIDLTEAITRTLGLERCYAGLVRIYGATVNGTFSLKGAHLKGGGEYALEAGESTINGSMLCDEGFVAEGGVMLLGARIGGNLSFRQACLNGKNGLALDGDGLSIAASMICDQGFQAKGGIRLVRSSIGGQLNFRHAHLDGRGGPALNADGLTVTASVFCEQFKTQGEVRLIGASIDGQLVLRSAHLDGKGMPALNAERLTVTANMFCDLGFVADGEVNLVSAKIGELVDDRQSWPQCLILNGLTYSDLTYMPARERLDWLSRSIGYFPQPYEQLAAYYRRLGHDEQARRVLLAKQRQRRQQRPLWTRWPDWLQDVLAGYGYAPGRAFLLLAGAFVAGWLVFSARHPTPVGPGPHPIFNAALYTLDLLIPAPAFGLASDWDPRGLELLMAAGLHILGWLLAITVIAAITRSFSKS